MTEPVVWKSLYAAIDGAGAAAEDSAGAEREAWEQFALWLQELRDRRIAMGRDPADERNAAADLPAKGFSGKAQGATEGRPARMLPIILREVRCEGCGREYWPLEEHYREHWIMWRVDDRGCARGVRIECCKCHRRTASSGAEGHLCDLQLTGNSALPGWIGAAAFFSAFSMLVTYSWPDARDRARIERIAEAMSFAHLAES